jgi:hypothetical protein
MPHRNDVPRLPARCPNQNCKPAGKIAGGDVSPLSVILASVLTSRGASGKHLLGVAEIEAAISQRCFELGCIEGDLQVINVSRIIYSSRYR